MNKFAISAAVLAATSFSTPAAAYDRDAWALGLGYAEVFGSRNNAVVGNIEYRSAAYAPEQFLGIRNISWIVGAELDTNSSAYAYGGLLYDIPLTNKWSLSPSLAAGFYTKGDGKDLGGAFQLRQNLELNYKFTEASRIGLAFSHKSNAGIYSDNPGTETLQITYSVSLD